MYDIIKDPNNECSAINVQKAVDAPEQVNSEYLKKYKKQSDLSIDEYVEGILNQNRVVLSRAITLVESSLPSHQAKAQAIIEKCLKHSGNSIRLGITGVPGAGKSTVIEALGTMLTKKGHKVAVLAIDPSSQRSKGSILGDKTRMEELSNDENAFIRPSPSSGSLGGVAQKTREIVLLCEASGFDTIIIETVGVGQSEIAVHTMVDFFLLIQIAGAGDELQGIKRGIMEMADMVAINKAEGNNKKNAELAAGQYRNALHLFPLTESKWAPQVITCSAYTGDGIDKIWDIVKDYEKQTKENGFFYENRNQQNLKILSESIDNRLRSNFYNNPLLKSQLSVFQEKVVENKISAYIAADKLLEAYITQIKNNEI